VIVTVELPLPGAGMVLGLNVTVVPGGAPVADRLIALLKLPVSRVDKIAFPADPGASPSTLGEVVIVKPGCTGAVTVRPTVKFWMDAPAVPVRVKE
jgi:hypothetical protein